MIFDFISGEASTQEGGEKFAKWLAEDTDLTQKEKKSVVEKIKDFFAKLLDAVRSVIEGQGTLNTTARAGQKAAQQVPVLDDFFNALDNAIDNRQRMLDGDTASKADLRDDIRYSKKLGQFTDVNVNSEEELKSLGFDAKFPRLKDYIHVQKTVIKALNDRGFFDNNHNIVVNADTDIVVDIGRSGIRETFSTERRYAQLPMDKKRAKLAVLTKLPEMIKFAEVENPGENNRHGGSSKFLVLKHPATIDGKEYSVTLRIKLTPQKNKFYIHDMTLFNQNKSETNSSIAPEDTSAVIYNAHSSRNGSVAESGQNVNTHSMQNRQKNAQNGKNNTRHSLEVDREYQRAGEEQKAKIIEQQAKEWGAYTDADGKPVKLYHGTSQFGFTEFDLNKMGDGRSIFMTSDPVIASTYSGVEGGKKISERNQVDVDTVSNKELAALLNQHAQEATVDYDYSVMDMQGRNDLITHVNGELEWLKGEVDREIEQFNGDGETVRKLQDLKNALDKNSYDQLSTKIYMLLHYGDTFHNSAEQSQRISQAEQDVRLLNQVRQLDHAEPMIVEKALGGYSIDLLSVEEAKNRLKQCINKGNYSLYAKLENPLVVDAFGDYWNGLDYRVPQDRYEVRNQYGAYQVFDRNTMQPAWIDGKMNWNTAAEAQQALGTLTDNKMDKRLTTTRDIAEYAKASGYDGVVFKRIKDSGGENVKVPSDREADVYVAFNPNAVKSADTITYDNDGKIIPPSKRFTDQSDIRYSKQIEVDEFDEAGYDVINTTGKKGYADLKREVMTWDTDRHMNEVRCITIGSGFMFTKCWIRPQGIF